MFHKSTARVGRVLSFSNVTHEESRTWSDQTYKKKPGSATEEWVWDPETTDKLTTLNCKDPRGDATYVTFKEWGIGSQMMIEAHSSHLIFGLSVVQADIATSKAAGRYVLPFFTLLGSHTSKRLCSTEAPPTVSASPNIMLITALCLSPCWPINQEKYVVWSRNRGKQGSGSGSIGDPTTEGVKKWIRPFNFIEGKHCSEADNLPTLYQCCSIGHSKSGIGLSTQIEESNCNEADTFCTLYQFGCIQFPIVPKLRKTMLFAKSPCTLPNLFVLVRICQTSLY